jgi:hypothetical protein
MSWIALLMSFDFTAAQSVSFPRPRQVVHWQPGRTQELTLISRPLLAPPSPPDFPPQPFDAVLGSGAAHEHARVLVVTILVPAAMVLLLKGIVIQLACRVGAPS